MKYWRDQGAPAEKLIVGLTTYGRTFRLSSAATGLGAPASGPASAGPFTREPGFWSYYEVSEGSTVTVQQWGHSNNTKLNLIYIQLIQSQHKGFQTIKFNYFLSFIQICTFLQGGSLHWTDEQMVPYATKGNEWVGFDNKRSLEIKVIIKTYCCSHLCLWR